jgi:hypothetical protein
MSTKQKAGLFLSSAALFLFSCVVPFLPSAGHMVNAVHFVMGLALGLGTALMIHAQFLNRRVLRSRS